MQVYAEILLGTEINVCRRQIVQLGFLVMVFLFPKYLQELHSLQQIQFCDERENKKHNKITKQTNEKT